MSRLFDSIQLQRPKRSKFDLSHEVKMSMNMGALVPIMCTEVLPGDRFRVNSEVLMRFAPMLAPIMHRVNVYTHWFYVPTRIIWDEFQDFITGGRLGTSAPVSPYMPGPSMASTAPITLRYWRPGQLVDYLGLPVFDETTYPDVAPINPMYVSALPLRAYQLIYDDYYRDQNLEASLDISKASGAIADGAERDKLLTLRQRAWEKDYFTSCLPFAQRGNPLDIPVNVDYRDQAEFVTGAGGGTAVPVGHWAGVPADGVAGQAEYSDFITPGVGQGILGIKNIDDAGISINDLRRSNAVQKFLEAMGRGGARFKEQILNLFGVVSDDARLQRPEYLGGSKNACVISEVLSSFQADGGDLPQGNMSGHGISVGSNNGFSRSFKEHGYVIGIMSVLPRTAYQQGVPKMFTRGLGGKLDYAFPQFANLGEQVVTIGELMYDILAPADTGMGVAFGYQSRYAEYKYERSRVSGDFRDALSYWHMGRIFDTQPSLNQDFVASDPTTRIFAVTDPDIHKLYVQVYNSVSAVRPLPYYGTPRL